MVRGRGSCVHAVGMYGEYCHLKLWQISILGSCITDASCAGPPRFAITRSTGSPDRWNEVLTRALSDANHCKSSLAGTVFETHVLHRICSTNQWTNEPITQQITWSIKYAAKQLINSPANESTSRPTDQPTNQACATWSLSEENSKQPRVAVDLARPYGRNFRIQLCIWGKCETNTFW